MVDLGILGWHLGCEHRDAGNVPAINFGVVKIPLGCAKGRRLTII